MKRMILAAACAFGLASASSPDAEKKVDPNPGQVTEDEKALIEKFMVDYEQNYSKYKETTEKASKILSEAIKDAYFLVAPDVAFRTKDPVSLKNKLLERALTCEYTSAKDIDDDIVDIIGLRLIAYTPSVDLPVIDGILRKSMNVLQHKPATDKYPGHNYRALIDGVKVEVQARSILNHAMLQVDHKLLYKTKPEYKLSDDEMKEFKAWVSHIKDVGAELDTFIGKFFANHLHGKKKDENAEGRFAQITTSVDADMEGWQHLPSYFPDTGIEWNEHHLAPAAAAEAEEEYHHGGKKLLRSNQ